LTNQKRNSFYYLKGQQARGGFVYKIFICILILLAILTTCLIQTPKVAVLYSYYPDYKWVVRENNGFLESLNSQKNDIKNFYLDSKKKDKNVWQNKVCPEVMEEIKKFDPNLLVAFDDNALQCLEMYKDNISYPILFSGINTNPDDYEIDGKIGGVVGTIHLKESLDLLKTLGIESEDPVLITDNSTTSQHFLEQISQVEFREVVQSNDFSLWQQKILAWQNSEVDVVCVLLYHNLYDNQDNYLSPPQFINWLQEYNTIPEIGFFDFTIEDGLLCGVTTSGYDQAKMVGKMATAYLEEDKFPSRKIHLHPAGKPRINIERAREMGIEINKIQTWR